MLRIEDYRKEADYVSLKGERARRRRAHASLPSHQASGASTRGLEHCRLGWDGLREKCSRIQPQKKYSLSPYVRVDEGGSIPDAKTVTSLFPHSLSYPPMGTTVTGVSRQSHVDRKSLHAREFN